MLASSSKTVNTGAEGIKDLTGFTAYPNPFSNQVSICYHNPKQGMVKVKIFNTSGQQVETLVSRNQTAGDYTCKWNPQGLPLGIYLCKIETAASSQAIKLIMHK